MDIYYSFVSLCTFREIEFLLEHILTINKIGLVKEVEMTVGGQLSGASVQK